MSRASTFGHSGFFAEAPAALAGTLRRWPAVAAGVLWLAAGLSAGYWVLLAVGRSPVTPVAAPAPVLPVPDPAALARVLGAVEAPAARGAEAPPPTRYQLLGVVASGGQQGAALIAVDGKPPKPYRVGAPLEGGMVLQSVGVRSVRLGTALDQPGTVELTLPPANPS